jgi:chromosome segregation ATPase
MRTATTNRELNLAKTELSDAHSLAAISQAQLAEEAGRSAGLQGALDELQRKFQDKDKELLAVGKRLVHERSEVKNLSTLLDDLREKLTEARTEAEQLRREAAARKRELPAPPAALATQPVERQASLERSVIAPSPNGSIMSENEREGWREAVYALRRLVDKLEAELSEQPKIDPNALRNATKDLERKLAETASQRDQVRMELDNLQSLLRASQQMDAARAATLQATQRSIMHLQGPADAKDEEIASYQSLLQQSEAKAREALQTLQGIQGQGTVQVDIVRETVRHRPVANGRFEVGPTLLPFLALLDLITITSLSSLIIIIMLPLITRRSTTS